MKVSGSYTSVVRGVSQQVPADRFPGQSYEQINLISDPVRGLTRRHGSELLGYSDIGGTPTDYPLDVEDTKRMKVYTMDHSGATLDILYRAYPSTRGRKHLLHAYNKVTNQFIPVVYADDDPFLDTVASGGVSAIVNIGQYLLVAGNEAVPIFSEDNKYDATGSRAAIWIRSGNYARTYQATVSYNSTMYVGAYTTMTSAYPGTLDTSGIPASDPEYQKKVNDINAAYTTAQTQWIADATIDITPRNIAEKLMESLIAAGMDPAAIATSSSTITMTLPGMVEVQVNDGGDGTSIRGVGRTITALENVTTTHYEGKVVRVQPKKADATDALYLKAVAVRPGATGWTEVRWVETAGIVQTPTEVFLMGVISGGTLYVASTQDKLEAISGLTADDVPKFISSASGDLNSTPPPAFFDARIDYMALFQDRLLITSGSTVFMSRSGDYFNWYPATVVAQADSDPIEVYALGTEGDIIVAGATYDRNLVLFGQKFQYTVNGRSPMTPLNASIVTQSAHEQSVDAFPVNSGNLVFYMKYRNEKASAHQIQIGLVADSPESFEISQPLDTYLRGRPVEVVALTSPNVVVIRTQTERQRVYVYTYLDTASQERLFDSWSSWVYCEDLGSLVGIGSNGGDLLMYWLREGYTEAGEYTTWLACDTQTLDTEPATNPHLDSWRPAQSTMYDMAPLTPTNVSIAMQSNTPGGMLGTPYDRLDEFLRDYSDMLGQSRVGFNFVATVTPTNPFMRDRNDKVITNGRLTLGRVLVTLASTGGMYADLEVRGKTTQVVDFSARITGRSSNRVGIAPSVNTTIPIPVGQDTTVCKYTIRSRTWLPLTVTALEWVGQYFLNSRRV